MFATKPDLPPQGEMRQPLQAADVKWQSNWRTEPVGLQYGEGQCVVNLPVWSVFTQGIGKDTILFFCSGS